MFLFLCPFVSLFVFDLDSEPVGPKVKVNAVDKRLNRPLSRKVWKGKNTRFKVDSCFLPLRSTVKSRGPVMLN